MSFAHRLTAWFFALSLTACGSGASSDDTGTSDDGGDAATSGITGNAATGGSAEGGDSGGDSAPGTSGDAPTSGGSSSGGFADTDVGTTQATGDGDSTGETEGDTEENPWNEGDPDDPFAFASCGGEPLTVEDALSLVGSGETAADLGAYRVFHRSRECNRLTGCTDWSVSPPHSATQRLDVDALFGGPNRPPVGGTAVSINPETADVELRFGNPGWCSQTIDGELESPCDIEPLLLPPAGDGSWTIEPALLRRNCFMFRAHGVEPVDNSVNEREFEVVIRGDHAIDRTDVSDELLADIVSVPESLICWGHTHNPVSCSPHYDTYSAELWDLEATFQPGVGEGMGTIDIDVPQFDFISAIVELDDAGYGVFSAPSGANGSRTVRASLGEGVLIIRSGRSPNFQNTCVAGTDWSCAGVYTTGI